MRRRLEPRERWVLTVGALVAAAAAYRLGLRGSEPLLDMAVFLGGGLLLVAAIGWAWSHGLFGGSDD